MCLYLQTVYFIYLYIYISCVRVYVTELLLDGWTDFDEILCVCLSGSLDGLDSQLDPVGGAAIGFQEIFFLFFDENFFLFFKDFSHIRTYNHKISPPHHPPIFFKMKKP